MRDCVVRMKDGQTWQGPLWTWRPKEGWFMLAGDREASGPDQIFLRDVEEATQRGRWVNRNTITDTDLLERARQEGWDGT